MQTQLYFWKPLIERLKKELSVVLDYFNKSKIYFDNIENESKEYGDKLFREYQGYEDTDFADVAEWAQEESVELYFTLLTMKSNHLLMTISLLYHTWEQQLIKFTIGEMSHYFKFSKKAMDFKEVQAVFRAHGVAIPDTQAWSKIRELKFLTNTIKHGDGDSAEKLRRIRPDFFKSPFAEYSISEIDTLKLKGAVLLDGYSLNVKEQDFLDYVEATQSFWDEMPERAFSDVDTIMSEISK